LGVHVVTKEEILSFEGVALLERRLREHMREFADQPKRRLRDARLESAATAGRDEARRTTVSDRSYRFES
jgi:hypothetical protein